MRASEGKYSNVIMEGKLRFVKKLGPVAYWLDLSKELKGVHDTFHVSNIKKCLADPTLQVPLDEIRVDAKLNFVEEPVEILERVFKKLKRSRSAIVKVWWNSKRGPKFTWEREDQMKLKYPCLFSDDKICAYGCYVNIMHDYWIGWVRLPSVVRLLDWMGTPTQYLCNYWSGWVSLPSWQYLDGTDIAKISRKRSKLDNHRHGIRIECAKARRMLSKSLTSQEAPIGQNPYRSTRGYWKETHQSLGLCSNTLTKEALGLTHGLPSWQSVCLSI
ncbi:hypothetical protein Tco_0273408 [Tanacetum coccineum]